MTSRGPSSSPDNDVTVIYQISAPRDADLIIFITDDWMMADKMCLTVPCHLPYRFLPTVYIMIVHLIILAFFMSRDAASLLLLNEYVTTFRIRYSQAKCIVTTAVCVSMYVCLSLAAFPHCYRNPDGTWGNGRKGSAPSCARLGGVAIGARD